MIKVEHLTKRYVNRTVVDDVSFEVKRGEVVGFLGPNGAGKTTTLRMLSTYLSPTGGSITIDGLDAIANSYEVRRHIGYLPENVPLYHDMRVSEYLRYRAKLRGMGGRRLLSRYDEVVSRCGLGDVTRMLVGKLSRGYTQRVGLADCLISEPQVLLLDEPTVGLDPTQIRQIRNLIKSLAQKHTILLSSHILPEIEMTCQRVLIIDRGRIVASGTADHLVQLIKGGLKVSVEVQGPAEEIRSVLNAIPGVVGVSTEASGELMRFDCACEPGADVRMEVFRRIAARGWVIRELRVESRNLEDVFVRMTSDQEKL